MKATILLVLLVSVFQLAHSQRHIEGDNIFLLFFGALKTNIFRRFNAQHPSFIISTQIMSVIYDNLNWFAIFSFNFPELYLFKKKIFFVTI